jgi:hypothetical protein
VQRGAGEVGFQREPVPVAADELHDRLDAELPQRDRHRERRRVRVRSGVVGGVDGVDPRRQRLDPRADGVDPAAVDRGQLARDHQPAGSDPAGEPRHPPTPPAPAGRAR